MKIRRRIKNVNRPICTFSALKEPHIVYSVSLPYTIVEEINREGYTIQEYIRKSLITQLIHEGKDLCRKCDYGLK